jgi:dinuclear metal center YbgI/SA1388 family protein
LRALKLIQILEIANTKFPFDCSEPWDNSGIQVGDLERDIKNIAFSLDANPSTIRFAKENSCELLITHHPILLNPVKKIVASDLSGQTLFFAIASNVDVVSLHTNLDAAQGGLNDYLADLLGLLDVVTPEDASCARLGAIAQPMTLVSFRDLVKQRLLLESAAMICDGVEDKETVSRVFLASGSGASYLPVAIRTKADVMVTGDVRYHAAVDARRSDLPIIDAGHFGMEKHAIKLMADTFKREFEGIGLEIVCHECPFEMDPLVPQKN